MKFNLTGTEQLPEGAFVNLASAGRVVDESGAVHFRIVRGQSIAGCTVEEPSRLQAAVDRGHLIVEEVD